MRVTSTVKDYIRKEVKKRLMPRYEAEKSRADYEKEARDAIYERMEKYITQKLKEFKEEVLSEGDIADFIEMDIKADYQWMGYRTISIKDTNLISSCHQWEKRFNKEAEEKVNEIIVELELGGTKETLAKLLEEI